MAVAKFSLSRIISLKSSSPIPFSALSKCPNRNWCTLATLNLRKPRCNYKIFSSHGFKVNSTLKLSVLCNKQFPHINSMCPLLTEQHIRCSTSTPDKSSVTEPQLSKKDKLKRAVKEYGATVIIFHVTISLFSLGVAYLAVTSGVDVQSLLVKVGLRSGTAETMTSGTNMLGTTGDVAAEVSTFVIAYAVHKVFAPVRISITLFALRLL